MSRHPLYRALCTTLLLASARPLAAQNPLDRLRRAATAAANIGRTFLPISTEKEIDIGRGVAATVAGRYPISRDTAINRYVNLVGLAVASVDPRGDIAYHFAVLDTPDVNAFARISRILSGPPLASNANAQSPGPPLKRVSASISRMSINEYLTTTPPASRWAFMFMRRIPK